MSDDRVARIANALVLTAGGFLRNPGGPSTCRRCYTPITSAGLCGQCQYALTLAGVPATVGMMTYAGYFDPIAQSGRVMRGYKSSAFNSAAHRQTVSLLAALGLLGHVTCAGRLAGAPVSAWATVPSLPPKAQAGRHPLNEIVRALAKPGATEIELVASSSALNPRDISLNHYQADGTNALDRHVLLIDDTWTSGGHASSAALALRAAGAGHVSILVFARWLSIGWEATTTAWAKQRLTAPDFAPTVCPWTQAQCP